MNELEIKQIIDKNKILLEERAELQLDLYDKRYEIKELEDQIIMINEEKRVYKKLKIQKLKEYVINMLQITAILGSFALVCSIEFLNISANILSTIYISTGSICGALGFLLAMIYNDELKDYRKKVGLEIFDKNNLANLEQLKNVKEEELKKITKRMNKNSRMLDHIYNITNTSLVEPIYNNEYSNEDENVNVKQKKIEK